MITLFIESCLHVHANLRSPNVDTQNSTQICGVYWVSMQVWSNQNLTPQNFTNMNFSIKGSQHFDFLHFNSTINLNNEFQIKVTFHD